MFGLTIVSSHFLSPRNTQLNQCARIFTTTLLKADQPPHSSIDPSSVNHFGNLAVKWWDEKGSMKPLHSMNSLRVPLIRDGLFMTGAADSSRKNTPKPLNDLKIVDVGCGGGLLSEPLARLGAFVTGIDASSELIGVAKQHSKLESSLEGRLNYINTVAEKYVLEAEEKYDAVVSSEVIEHVQDQYFFLEQCTKLLKPKGSIFLTTMNRTTASWLLGILAAENVFHVVPKGSHEWEKFVQPLELRTMLEKCGCSTKLIHGMCYNPFTDVWKWSQNVSINYAIHAVKVE